MQATTTKPAAKPKATKKLATSKKTPAAKKRQEKATTKAAPKAEYVTAEAAIKAALADGRERTAVIQIKPGVFTLGSRRAALKAGYTFLGRAAALVK